MFVALLGPLEVTNGEGRVAVAGARLASLLVRLAVVAPRPVSTDQLIEAIWDGNPPLDAANSLQSLVSRLRRALGDGAAVAQTPAGYRLTVTRASVDVLVCADLQRQARELRAGGDLDAAATTYAAALELWRGAPSAPAEFLPDRAELTCEWADVLAATGGAAQAVEPLSRLAELYPLREDVTRSLMGALRATGRTAEALASYERLRRVLADELGVDPSDASRAAHLALLAADREPSRRDEDAAPSNLRAELTSFIGREDDVARIDELLGRERLVTVIGPGGVGKTRLAARVGRSVLSRYPDGVWLVELAPITDEGAVPTALLAAVGVRNPRPVEGEPRLIEPMQRLIHRLEFATTLLVVDNCEHLIEPVALLVAEILGRCPQVSVLATSREPLNLAGESLVPIRPLQVDGVAADDGEPPAAVRLFGERARAAAPEFRLDDATRPLAEQIVRRLDGLPLAIELAAARMRVMPLSEIADRLSDRFRLLTGGSRTALPRHRTLRAVVEWSWDLLTGSERQLIELLAVFPSGCTAAGATAVATAAGLADGDVPGLLDALVDKSLLQRTPVGSRYRMLETIREFGTEELVSGGRIEQARLHHARYFLSEARQLAPQLRTFAQPAAVAEIDAERENLEAALRYLVEAGDVAGAADLGLSLLWYWTISGRHRDAVTVLHGLVETTEGVDDVRLDYLRAGLEMSSLSNLTSVGTPDWVATQERLREISARLNRHEDTSPLGMVLRLAIALFSGSARDGIVAIRRALTSDDPWVRGVGRSLRIGYLENGGRLDRVRAEVELALRDLESVGDLWAQSGVLNVRGSVRALDGDLPGAIADYEAALAAVSRLNTLDDDTMFRMRLVDLRLRTGDLDGAREALTLVHGKGQQAGDVTAVLARVSEILVTFYTDGPDVAIEQAVGLRELLDEQIGRPSILRDHLVAMCHAALTMIHARAALPDQAARDAEIAYRAAVTSEDMPLLSNVGAPMAMLAIARGRFADAAQILGATTRLRGAEDTTDLETQWVRRQCSAALGEQEFMRQLAIGLGLTREAAIARLDPAMLGETGDRELTAAKRR